MRGDARLGRKRPGLCRFEGVTAGVMGIFPKKKPDGVFSGEWLVSGLAIWGRANLFVVGACRGR
jgi:hypothetical protein